MDVNADKLFEAMEIEFRNIIEIENIRNVENMDIKFENIKNTNIRDEVFEVFKEIEVDFENIMDQESSDEEMLSDDSECAGDIKSIAKKFVSAPEIRTLNARTKHCVIHDYYTTGDASIICIACMIRIALMM